MFGEESEDFHNLWWWETTIVEDTDTCFFELFEMNLTICIVPHELIPNSIDFVQTTVLGIIPAQIASLCSAQCEDSFGNFLALWSSLFLVCL